MTTLNDVSDTPKSREDRRTARKSDGLRFHGEAVPCGGMRASQGSCFWIGGVERLDQARFRSLGGVLILVSFKNKRHAKEQPEPRPGVFHASRLMRKSSL